MKKIACTAVEGPADCPHVFEVESFEDLMKQGPPHFMDKHADLMANAKPEDMAEHGKTAKAAYDAAPEE